MDRIDPIYRTVFSELERRCLDAEFDLQFPETGLFKKVTVKGRGYWYFHERISGRDKMRYVGPVSDEDITKRVASFRLIKDDFKARRRLVTTLTNDARLPAADREIGDIIEAFWKAGLFRLRAVVVGSAAYGCYAGLLGVRLDNAHMMTSDVDFAQFHSISVSVEDSIAPVLDVLKSVDDSFRLVPHQLDGRVASKFVNAGNFKVEFLTPNTGKDEHQSQPPLMPALGGASAQPLRFLDFLIHEPVRTVLLHKGGIPVLVPAPHRYAIHKLIVATRRMKDGSFASKREKDLKQATSLIEALVLTRSFVDLAEAWMEAWNRGDKWRTCLSEALALLRAEEVEMLIEGVDHGAKEFGHEASHFGLNIATRSHRL